MNKTTALILLAPDDADAASFRDAIASRDDLRDRVELRFARTQDAQEAIADADIIACGNLSPELLDAASNLRWIAFWSAGLDGKVTPQLAARNLFLTNASGVHGPNIAEHVLAWMLMFTRRMDVHFRGQLAGQWQRWPVSRASGAEELGGQTLGIVGLGRIGEALTTRAKSFGMRVVAVKRNPDARYEADVSPDALYAPDDLPRLLAESDHVCIALPYTPDTHHLFDAAMLAHMKPTAYLYNIARGKIVDEAALTDALREHRLAGAGLDVFETEPLPPDSPLWSLDNVLITPHTAGQTPYYFTRAAALFADNLARYLEGQPLHNLYDPKRGY